MKKLIKKIICWWFGCRPDYDGPVCGYNYGSAVPCSRCGSHDTSYADRVGETRHAAMVESIKYWGLRKWVPEKCPDCGKRYGDHGDCLPF